MNKNDLKKFTINNNLFDEEYYLRIYPHAKKSRLAPLEHFLKVGIEFEYNPSLKFDNKIYKKMNQDVADAGINSYIHFCNHGMAENRIASKADLISDDLKHIRETIEEFLDIDYLEEQINLKVDDVVYYYLLNPLKLNPNQNFDTNFYLSVYKDVRDAGVNPFYHFIQNGKKESRLPKKIVNSEEQIISSGYDLKHKLNTDYKKIFLDDENYSLTNSENIFQAIVFEIQKNKQNKLAMAFSHDSYIESVGGVQTCLLKEQIEANRNKIAYMSIYPHIPLMRLRSEEQLYGLTLDGIFQGLINCSTLKYLTSNLCKKFNSYLLIHTLQGQNINTIGKIADNFTNKKTYYWVHDYFSICESYTLFRNDVEYCYAPSIDSSACEVCLHGDRRKEHLQKINSLFSKIGTFITPSPTSTKLMLDQYPMLEKKILTKPHYDILDAKISLKNIKKIKVAYCGYASYHKGYFDFIKIADQLSGNKKFKFFKLSNDSIAEENITNIPVAVSHSNPLAMVNALKKQKIDIVIMPSKWPETFNLVTYEALSAKVPVLVIGKNGHPSKIIKSTGLGWVVETVNDAIEILIELPVSGTITIEDIKIAPSQITIDLLV